MKKTLQFTCPGSGLGRQLGKLLLAAAVILNGAGALAQSLSFEPFTGYTVGTELTANIPAPVVAGYTGNWTNADFGSKHPMTVEGSLVYGGAGYAAGVADHIWIESYTGVIGAGNSGRMFRLLNSTLRVDSTTAGVRYLSFLYQSGQETGGATVYQMLDLYNSSTADANRTFTAGLTSNGGQSGSEYDFAVTETYTSTGVAADTAVHLFVVKFDLSATANSDSVTVWIDPTLGAGEPAGGVTVTGKNIAFDRLSISDYSGGNSGAWDEIRWGTTFDSVTIVAPPAPTVFAPVLSASPRYAHIGQTIPLVVTIPTNANASSTVKLVLTNDNPGAISLPGGNLITNTFTAGATNVQVINASVVGAGVANINVVTNATFSFATIQLGELTSPDSFESFAGYAADVQLPANVPAPAVPGYSGDWTSVDFGDLHPATISGSLVYTSTAGYAAGEGAHIGIASYTGGIGAANSGRMYRLLSGSSLGVDSTSTGTRYLSFLYQSGQEAGATVYQMLDLYNGNTADQNRTFTAGLTQNGGYSGSEYNFGVNEAYYGTGVAADTAVHLIVVKFDLSATDFSDSVTVWIDPTLGAGEPVGGVAVTGQNIVFDRLTISSYSGGNSGAWDEIRWGETFDSVTIVAPPVPPIFEPVLSAAPRYAPIGQTIPLTVTIPTSANASNTVSLVLTNDNASALTLPGGNPTTLTFTAGATNVQIINVSVVGVGVANISVVTNATFSSASIQLGALTPPASYESFSGYAADVQLPANVPGPAVSGYLGDWTSVDFGDLHPATIAGSLVYTNTAGYAAGAGAHIGIASYTGGIIDATNSGRMYRLLSATSLLVNSNTTGTRYLSFLYQSGQEAGATFHQMLDLYNGNTADGNRTFTAGLTQNGGNTGSEYDFGVNETYYSTGVAADTAVHLIVVKFDLSATDFSDSVTVWIDPTLGSGEPTSGVTVFGHNIAFDRLAISDYSAGNSGAWDEIRWGETFDSVTIVAPQLSIRSLGGGQVRIAWPEDFSGLVLNSSTNLLGSWSPAGLSITTQNGQNSVTDTVSGSAKFYRLLK